MAFLPVRLGDQPDMDQSDQGFSPNKDGPDNFTILPRDDSNSRYRLCFARRRPRVPVAGAIAASADETAENLRPPRLDRSLG